MKVSVWMTAYNHENYLRRCLDSVLMQKTDFEFDIVLGEDCSQDRTREIAIEYSDRHPGKFTLFLPEKNIGMMKMDTETHNLCKGQYLALLNGDDYWTDEYKLQIQADCLDANADTEICFHKAEVINETDGTSFETVFLEESDELPAESLLKGYNPIMTPTVMVRNNFEIPEWYESLPYGDMPLYLMLSQKGKIRYIDRKMSVYRIHGGGQWQGDSLKNNLEKDLKFYEVMNEKLGYRYSHLIGRIFARRYFDLTIICIRLGLPDEARNYFAKLTDSGAELLIHYKTDIENLKSILTEGKDASLFEDTLAIQPKWKID